jgi:hypothetical protein
MSAQAYGAGLQLLSIFAPQANFAVVAITGFVRSPNDFGAPTTHAAIVYSGTVPVPGLISTQPPVPPGEPIPPPPFLAITGDYYYPEVGDVVIDESAQSWVCLFSRSQPSFVPTAVWRMGTAP